MNKALVVVESPAKAKTIEKFLGAGFKVKASMGHLRDLPKSQFGIDIENDFMPKYINIRGKGDIIKGLKDAAKSYDKVYLASDLDREGEAIAWHLAHLLNIPPEKACRIEFNEITKSAIQNAIKHPRPIHYTRVDAQQARRLLDRIVGYKLSPLLWRKVRKGLSAGRVQSVAVRIICDREKEVLDFVEQEYWSVTVKLREQPKTALFEAELLLVDGEKAQIANVEQADKISQELEQAAYLITDVKRRERRRNPAAPFTTSSLQQDASRKLGFTTRKTMVVAQQLYEGLEVGSTGPVGLITYMRTDSTRVADSAQQEARKYIEETYGKEYVPEKPPVYAAKKSQDAHEAIRPTSLQMPPKKVAKNLSAEQLKVYTLIWDRFVASQMAPAIYDTTTADISAGRFTLRATGSVLKFAGFVAVYTEGKDEKVQEKDMLLPHLEAGQQLQLHKILPKQHFTEPPPRYSEASLVRILEEKGIGRPSTYAPIIETILARGYVNRVEKRFRPTELGIIVVDLLKEHFPSIVDVEFTAKMEQDLDEIAEGNLSRIQLLRDFYEPFSKTLADAEAQIGTMEVPDVISDTPCELCGRMMVIKRGRYGEFLACPGFPECRNAKPIIKEIGIKCPKCEGSIVERRTKRGKVFYGCNKYPDCDFVSWDKPLAENCETCGAFLAWHTFKNGRSVKMCSNPECAAKKGRTDEKSAGSKTEGSGKVSKKTKSSAKSGSSSKNSDTRRKKSV